MRERQRPIGPTDNVFARYGGFVGTVETVNQGTMRVRGPGPRHSLYYIPVGAISGELARGQYVLDCTVDELPDKGWDRAPDHAAWVVRPGAYVYGSSGGYAGVVEYVGENYIRVRGPQPTSTVYYIPPSEFGTQLGDGREVALRCTLEELEAQPWKSAPDRVRSS